MRRQVRDKVIFNGVVFALVFCLAVRPVLNAADPESSPSHISRSLAEELFQYAGTLSSDLHNRPPEQRSAADYRRVLDAYGQVIRLNTEMYFSAESLARRAELLREMADVSGDSALYQQSIETYRNVIDEHSNSAFVGDALISIAQIYEQNLQDLDGAAGAYRELAAHFPASVLGREARAVVARFEAELARRPVDVVVAPGVGAGDAATIGPSRLTNVRSFSGPDYARVVLDLSDASKFIARREANRVSFELDESTVARSLYGRRFIVGESGLLRRVRVSQGTATGIQIDIDLSTAFDYSAFRLSDPERIVIDLRAGGIAHASESSESRSANAHSSDEQARAGKLSAADRNPLISLPEIQEPIVTLATARSAPPAANPADVLAKALGAKIDAKAAVASIHRIVIDPGHGGHDTGTISSGGMREKDLVLDVARRLRGYIKHSYPEVEVILTRDADRFVALEERTAIANSRRADLFISIHANASQSRIASGVETYFVSPDRVPAEDLQTAARENATLASAKTADRAQPVVASVTTMGNRVAESRELARYIQSGLVRGIGAQSPRTAANRGVKHAPFVVLLGASMPSVLAEVSFLSNPKDEALLQTVEFRERVAASLYAGLNAYLRKLRAGLPKGSDAVK
ncbi:MAG: N-acetylmuramoyl-L-alanine amidase [Acidobacteriota bacterium]